MHLARVLRKLSRCIPILEDANTYRWGIFRLTDPPGMNTVLHCSAPGIFHPHSETNMYTDALRPGHVVEAADMEYAVVDLRP